MLLITPCISASQIAVHGPPFRNTEDSQRSMESWQLAWDWLHLFAASYFDRCPRSSLLWRDWRPLRAAGSLKKKQQKTKTQEHTTASTATAMQTESSNVLIGNATSSPQQYMYSSSTLALYLWALWLKKGLQRAVLPPWRRDMSWVCLQCIICQQPETCFCLRSQLDGSLYTRGSEELTPRQEPFCGARCVISSGSVPCSYSDCFQTAPSVGRENERVPAEQRVYISSITRLHFWSALN